MVVESPVDSTAYWAPASTPFDVGISFVEKDDGLSVDKLLVLSCALELAMGRVTLEHVDQVVEVSEGNNIHFVRHEGSSGTQDLHHHVLGTRLALHK